MCTVVCIHLILYGIVSLNFVSVVFFIELKKYRVLICKFILLSMAPKDRKDVAWVHCQLIEGKFVCNYCQKEVGGGGINRLKQHLAGTRGNV